MSFNNPDIQSSRFCKRPWILNWSKWILLIDIPTQIFLTIMGSIDHYSRSKLDFYVIARTKRSHARQIDTFHKICKCIVKRVSKIWLRMSITNIHWRVQSRKFICYILSTISFWSIWRHYWSNLWGIWPLPSWITHEWIWGNLEMLETCFHE